MERPMQDGQGVREPRVLAVVTEIRLRSWVQVPALLSVSGPLIEHARTLPGNHRAEPRPTGVRNWCTLTCWDDEAALLAFVHGAPHREAMQRSAELSESMRFARRWWPGRANALSWSEALGWLAGD
jgi:hypothetical protein